MSVKYELFYEGHPEPVGKIDRVEFPVKGGGRDRGDEGLDGDEDVDSDAAEAAGILLRDAVHRRREVRDLAHCSAANLTTFPSSSPDEELLDHDILRFLILDGAPEKLRIVAPPPPPATPLLSSRSSGVLSRQPSSQPLRSRTASQTQRSEPGTPTGVRRDSAPTSVKRETDTIVVFVKNGDQTVPVEVEAFATVDAVKERMMEQEQIPVEQQRLMFAGNEIHNGRTLAEYHVQQGSELQLVLTLSSNS